MTNTRLDHKVLQYLAAIVIGASVIGCTSQPAIVADPPQHSHTPPEQVPWEEEYARTRPKPEVFEAEALEGQVAAGDKQEFNGKLEHSTRDKSGAWQVVSDVIAFPFRGIGWLVQQLF